MEIQIFGLPGDLSQLGGFRLPLLSKMRQIGTKLSPWQESAVGWGKFFRGAWLSISPVERALH